MDICKEGYLDVFVKPVSAGGWGLCEYIVSLMSENRAYAHTEIYAAIQASELDASIKALSPEQIRQNMDWMVGKTFAGVVIGRPENQTITYIPEV